MGEVIEVSDGTVREVGVGSAGMRHIAKRYPVEEGLEAGTTKQTGKPYLEEEK
ncbi:hypothetical protein LCGC14_1993190 [marine sediment metagenome]|uniref:Uncharacterized protein n=1 Tax=marine sediment metagenome TaxID=412755 RepID=A0A0F9I2M3_9ZZZZ